MTDADLGEALRAAGRRAGRREAANDTALSLRLPADVTEALRLAAERDGTTVSDFLRTAAIEKLGYCPTCKRGYEAGKGGTP